MRQQTPLQHDGLRSADTPISQVNHIASGALTAVWMDNTSTVRQMCRYRCRAQRLRLQV